MKYMLIYLLICSAASFALVYNEGPSKDTWTWPPGEGGSGPYGSSAELRTNILSSYEQEVVIGWDLTSIPSYYPVNVATVSVYRYDGYGGSSLECDLFRVTEDWDEATLNDTVGHDTGTIYDQITVTGNGWYEFDITPLAQDWVDEIYDNFGIVFYGTGGSGYYQRFYSKENVSNIPNLYIDYGTGP